MQILPENKKKTIIYLVILLLAAGASGYLWFTSRSAPVAPPQSANAPRTPSSQLLPFGNKIDTAILDSERFRALVVPAPLVLTPEELGKTDLFQ
ncbi:MAG: hypothetical protein A3K06_02040 [Candidatus Doudnabacteria bacterium RIFCSPHIGHO2_01_52_17]|uniref:Uncharacterized protein n=1 Tax=Candidatus Doudnabacteria bacterium RIFCSPHIGHO2_01_52_17 TaxID=1817820 RepID=A0A1F5NEE2_9BACT|nr:MAG: hypothetical protein A3K06_02040 [Candidatus Doudnabacteria bacterium RIFCSPHIGHO2_01_52_17]